MIVGLGENNRMEGELDIVQWSIVCKSLLFFDWCLFPSQK